MPKIVEEIIAASNTLIQATLPTFKPLLYAYDLEMNAEDRLNDRFAIIPTGAESVSGRSLGFLTIDHNFQIILTDQAQDKDSDAPLRLKVNQLYEQGYLLLKEFAQKKLPLPTPTNLVLLITGNGFESPELLVQNKGVALRMNINIQYRIKNK